MFRQSLQTDKPELTALLSAEGVDNSEMGFERAETWVYDENGIKGFFSLRKEFKRPYLIHFCVDRRFRTHLVARRLIGFLKNLLRMRGDSEAIINAPADKERLNLLISAYFKARPYAKNDGHNFYLIGV